MEKSTKQHGMRYLVKCEKCGYEWLARTPNPKYCALCGNPHPEKPRTYRK